jgi:flavin-binding protein dodecin
LFQRSTDNTAFYFDPHGGMKMAVIKVIEVIAQSPKGWEDAVQQAVAEASKSLRNIKNVYVKDMQAQVSNGKITDYRVNAKISFLVEE